MSNLVNHVSASIFELSFFLKKVDRVNVSSDVWSNDDSAVEPLDVLGDVPHELETNLGVFEPRAESPDYSRNAFKPPYILCD